VNQNDDHLVVYDSSGTPKWWSGTSGQGSSSRLVQQDDGNLVLYEGSTAIWASHTVQQQQQQQKHGHTLGNNERLNPDEKLTSSNGRFTAVLQTDGNFVVYEGSKPLWASGTSGIGNGAHVINQTDDNLVVYDHSGVPKWASGTSGRGGSAHLSIQDDGNLVLYEGSTAIWASNTVQEVKHKDTLHQGEKLHAGDELRSSDGRYRAAMQTDGNFVIYGGSALWASNTSGHNFHVHAQPDRNLVVYDSSGAPKWASGTSEAGTGTCKLIMQTDGNLVLYDGAGTPTWASGTSNRY